MVVPLSPSLRSERVVVLAAWLCLAAGLEARAEDPPCTLSLDGTWLARSGTDLSWSTPELDDSDWRSVTLPSTWGELDLGESGTVWFRRRSVLPAGWARDLTPNGPALLLGRARYGRYELYAGGRLVATSEDPSGLDIATSRVYQVPREAIGDDGTLLIALRFDRLEAESRRALDTGPAGRSIVFGDFATLAALADRERLRTLYASVPSLGLSFFFVLIGLYHFALFRHRRRDGEYFWFGVLALSFAAVNFLISPWVWEVVSDDGLAERLSSAGKHLAMAAQIQFLWVLLRRPIRRPLRAYQITHVVLAAAALVVPLQWLLWTYTLRAVFSLAFFPVMALVCIAAIRGGDAEGRLIGAAGALLAGAVLVYLGLQLAGWTVPPLPAWAFLIFVLAMVATLSRRFGLLHRELDALNRELEQRVDERTRELEGKSRNLIRKNRETLAAQEKLVRSEKLASLGQLVAGVVHEIKNPVEAMGEAVPELEKEIADLAEQAPEEKRDRIRESLKVLAKGAERIHEIVQNLRMFSHPEEVAVTNSDLHEVLDSTLSLLRGKLKDRIRVVRNYGEIPRIEVYESQIKQVLMNVLVNAVQSIEGEGTVTLTTSPEAGGRVSLSIRDTGRGMSELVRRRIFDPFFTTRTRDGGTGLGLSISHGIVKEHGGALGVQSVLGHGTEITITLPIRLAVRPRAAAGFGADALREGAEPSEGAETPGRPETQGEEASAAEDESSRIRRK